MIRVRAMRAGKVVARLVINLRMGKVTRHIVTNRSGIASIRVTPRTRRALVIRFWVGDAAVRVRAVPR